MLANRPTDKTLKAFSLRLHVASSPAGYYKKFVEQVRKNVKSVKQD